MMLAEPIQITQRITQVLERLGLRYFIGGSLASSLHGIPRATQDVDIVTEIQEDHIDLLVKALEGEFYIDASVIREAIHRQASFNVIHLATMFKVDIFILKSDAPSKEEMTRRERYQVSRYRRCRSCAFRHWCAGDCRGEVLALTGDPTAPSPHCEELQEVYTEMLWLISGGDVPLGVMSSGRSGKATVDTFL